MLPPVSSRILDLLGDDLPQVCTDRDTYLKVLRFAQLAWNYSIFPVDSNESNGINTGILQMPAQHRPEFIRRLRELSERKKTMFPDDHRLIVDIWIEVREQGAVVKASFSESKNNMTRK